MVSTDIDGRSTNSKIFFLKLKEVKWNVQLILNPVIDEPKLLFTGTNGLTKISIKDLNGKTIYHQYLQNADGLISLQASLN